MLYTSFHTPLLEGLLSCTPTCPLAHTLHTHTRRAAAADVRLLPLPSSSIGCSLEAAADMESPTPKFNQRHPAVKRIMQARGAPEEEPQRFVAVCGGNPCTPTPPAADTTVPRACNDGAQEIKEIRDDTSGGFIAEALEVGLFWGGSRCGSLSGFCAAVCSWRALSPGLLLHDHLPRAAASQTDIFEWHFVMRGPSDSEFEVGMVGPLGEGHVGVGLGTKGEMWCGRPSGIPRTRTHPSF